MMKNILLAGAALSLVASNAALADTPSKAAPAKVVLVKRARAAADPRKSQNVAGLSLPVLAIGAVAVGVGIAAAAGAFNTSP